MLVDEGDAIWPQDARRLVEPRVENHLRERLNHGPARVDNLGELWLELPFGGRGLRDFEHVGREHDLELLEGRKVLDKDRENTDAADEKLAQERQSLEGSGWEDDQAKADQVKLVQAGEQLDVSELFDLNEAAEVQRLERSRVDDLRQTRPCHWTTA